MKVSLLFVEWFKKFRLAVLSWKIFEYSKIVFEYSNDYISSSARTGVDDIYPMEKRVFEKTAGTLEPWFWEKIPIIATFYTRSGKKINFSTYLVLKGT